MTADSSINQAQRRNCCISRYEARHVLNKKVALVLVWNCLIWAAFESPQGDQNELISAIDKAAAIQNYRVNEYVFYLVPHLLWFISAFVSAWLVGWKIRMHDLIITGMAIMGLGVLLKTILYTIMTATKTPEEEEWVEGVKYIPEIMIYVGSAPIITNLLQLGIEQIPDASAAQLSSYVSWFVLSVAIGVWLNYSISDAYKHCLPSSPLYNSVYVYMPCFKLVSAILLTFTLCSNFLLTKTALLDHFPTSNTIRTIHHVLKYAAKHKIPENRSAFTYWEDIPPTRINFGKRKYGGPFTNEQVEDVKTFFRIFLLLMTMFLFMTTLYLSGFALPYTTETIDANGTTRIHSALKLLGYNMTSCDRSIIFYFTGSDTWWMLVGVLIYELVLHPILHYRIPSMLKRIGITAFLATLVCTFFMLLEVIAYSSDISMKQLFLQLGIAISVGVIKTLFFITSLEFICAQSPYTMRNFFISVAWCIYRFSSLTAGLVFSLWKLFCTNKKCPVVYSSLSLLLSIVGFVAYCTVAKWYRMRTRGHEDEHQQRWVEDVYDRYVSQRNNPSAIP